MSVQTTNNKSSVLRRNNNLIIVLVLITIIIIIIITPIELPKTQPWWYFSLTITYLIRSNNIIVSGLTCTLIFFIQHLLKYYIFECIIVHLMNLSINVVSSITDGIVDWSVIIVLFHLLLNKSSV
jgi:hypothetical protein